MNITHNPVEHPSHYCKGGIECVDVIRAVLGEKFKYYCQGNVIKYIFRCYDKNGVEDIKKARKYIDWMIEEENHEKDIAQAARMAAEASRRRTE